MIRQLAVIRPLAWIAVLAAACTVDGSLGRERGGGSGGGSGDGGADSGSSSAPGGSGSMGGSGSVGTGSTGAEHCAPDPLDGPCAACRRVNCCMELEMCAPHVACGCLIECHDMGNPDCTLHCGDDGGAHAAVIACQQSACVDVCP